MKAKKGGTLLVSRQFCSALIYQQISLSKPRAALAVKKVKMMNARLKERSAERKFLGCSDGIPPVSVFILSPPSSTFCVLHTLCSPFEHNIAPITMCHQSCWHTAFFPTSCTDSQYRTSSVQNAGGISPIDRRAFVKRTSQVSPLSRLLKFLRSKSRCFKPLDGPRHRRLVSHLPRHHGGLPAVPTGT